MPNRTSSGIYVGGMIAASLFFLLSFPLRSARASERSPQATLRIKAANGGLTTVQVSFSLQEQLSTGAQQGIEQAVGGRLQDKTLSEVDYGDDDDDSNTDAGTGASRPRARTERVPSPHTSSFARAVRG